MQAGAQRPEIDTYMIRSISQDARLPTPFEQTDNALLWVADRVTALTEGVHEDHHAWAAIMGSVNKQDAEYVFTHMEKRGLATAFPVYDTRSIPVGTRLQLSISGWERVYQLRQGAEDSLQAFMAMKYGDSVLDEMFRDCFRPAVKTTGFELIRLDDKKRAGIIDNHLRAEIRKSRFLLVRRSSVIPQWTGPSGTLLNSCSTAALMRSHTSLPSMLPASSI